MAVITPRRGAKGALPSEAADGELLVTTDTNEMFVGKGPGRAIVPVALPTNDHDHDGRTVHGVGVIDTRDVDSPPSYYTAIPQTTWELKRQEVVGVPSGATGHCVVQTISDGSGAPVKQIATLDDGNQLTRVSAGPSWAPWIYVDQYAIGDTVMTHRDPGDNWILRSSGGTFLTADWPALAALPGVETVGETGPFAVTAAGTGDFHTVAYGAGNWVATGPNTAGTRRSADGGATWAPVSFPFTSTAVTGLVYGKGLWAVAAGDRIYTSPDLATWTERVVAPMLSTFSDLAHDSGTFLAFTNNRQVLRSTDGVAWTAPYTANVPAAVWAVARGAGRWVVAGDGDATYGFTAYSDDDGVTWTANKTSNPGEVYGLAYGAGRWVGGSKDGDVVHSDDGGQTWRNLDKVVPGTLNDANKHVVWSVVYVEGAFYALSGSLGKSGAVLRSPDGTSWQVEHSTPSSLRAAAYHAGRMVVVGAAGATARSTFQPTGEFFLDRIPNIGGARYYTKAA